VPYTVSQRLTLAIVPRLAALLIRLLGCTLRYEDHTAPGVIPGNRIPGPTVFAFWHRSLLIAAYRFRNLGIAILISRSFDGELIARTVELLGFKAIRGSSSRGGTVALRQMAEAYRAGHRCAITADGPKGPAMVAKPPARPRLGAQQLGPLPHPQTLRPRPHHLALARPRRRGHRGRRAASPRPLRRHGQRLTPLQIKKVRHLDRRDKQPHRLSRSGETPVFVLCLRPKRRSFQKDNACPE
jgi:hypothetical protein